MTLHGCYHPRSCAADLLPFRSSEAHTNGKALLVPKSFYHLLGQNCGRHTEKKERAAHKTQREEGATVLFVKFLTLLPLRINNDALIGSLIRLQSTSVGGLALRDCCGLLVLSKGRLHNMLPAK